MLKDSNIKLYTSGNKGLNTKVIHNLVEDYLNFLYRPKITDKIDLKHMIELTGHLSHINSYYNLSTLLDLAVSRNYSKFCELFHSPFHNKVFDNNMVDITDVSLPTFVGNIIFLVENKEEFIDSIREKGYIINEGPQKWRGKINNINNLLVKLDHDYRDSLYNHYNFHVLHKSIPRYGIHYPLDRKHFYFSNVHYNNLGW